jgi:hypothetical protein
MKRPWSNHRRKSTKRKTSLDRGITNSWIRLGAGHVPSCRDRPTENRVFGDLRLALSKTIASIVAVGALITLIVVTMTWFKLINGCCTQRSFYSTDLLYKLRNNRVPEHCSIGSDFPEQKKNRFLDS